METGGSSLLVPWLSSGWSWIARPSGARTIPTLHVEAGLVLSHPDSSGSGLATTPLDVSKIPVLSSLPLGLGLGFFL